MALKTGNGVANTLLLLLLQQHGSSRSRERSETGRCATGTYGTFRRCRDVVVVAVDAVLESEAVYARTQVARWSHNLLPLEWPRPCRPQGAGRNDRRRAEFANANRPGGPLENADEFKRPLRLLSVVWGMECRFWFSFGTSHRKDASWSQVFLFRGVNRTEFKERAPRALHFNVKFA